MQTVLGHFCVIVTTKTHADSTTSSSQWQITFNMQVRTALPLRQLSVFSYE